MKLNAVTKELPTISVQKYDLMKNKDKRKRKQLENMDKKVKDKFAKDLNRQDSEGEYDPNPSIYEKLETDYDLFNPTLPYN